MERPPAYPYAPVRLVPAWRDLKAGMLAALAVAALCVALWQRLPIRLAALDEIVLTSIFPAILAFVLAFAPRPTLRASRIAKDLLVVWIILGVLVPPAIPLMIVAVPLVLAVSVFLAATPFGAGGEERR